jgi:predicted TPR repeat methyltransferase
MFTTSGDLRADRRLALGLQLKAQGDVESAISLIEQALELAPSWEAAHFALAEALEAAGRCEEAKEHYVAHLRHTDGDSRGASLRLAMLGAAPVPAKAPEAYVKTLFDEYAPRFEESLVRRLGYGAPSRLRDRLDVLRPAPPQSERVLDLGCGTGLAGEALRSRAAWLEGVDLSPAMIAQARRKGIYDALAVAEIENCLAAMERRFDLVVATDVLIYFGSLEGLLAGIRRVLAPGGFLAFTVQAAESDGFLLGADERYSHGHAYLVRCAAGAGLAIRETSPFVLRQEAGREVPGLLCFCSAALSEEQATPAAWSASPAPSFR